MNIQSQLQQSQYTAGIVLGRLTKETEKVQWIYDGLHDVQPYIYIVDDNTTTDLHLSHNHGREAAVYFTYIVEHYDALPDISFFWHGDDVVWHNNMLMGWNSTTTINRLDRDNVIKQGYVPSRCDHWPGCPVWAHFDPSRAEDRLDPHRLESLFNPTTFAAMFPNETSFPPFFAGTCCSQFAVSKATIRAHPIEYYINLQQWAMDPLNDDEESGRVFEYTWPFIFTGRGQYCPSMQDCYCQTYNFCIQENQDLIDLERWNALRTRREEVQWQLNFAQDALAERMDAGKEKGAGAQELEELKGAFQPEIDRLAGRLANLSQATWEKREGIIHYWKLPVPPTGW